MTTTTRLVPTAILLVMGASACRADQLYLKNGQVKVGKVVNKDADFVDFRISMQGGKMKMVKRYPAADVDRIEYDDETESTGSRRMRAKTTQDDAAPRSRPRSTRKIEDKPEFLKKALAKIDDGKLDSAVSDLARLVYACKGNEDELADLSQLCEDQAGQPLGELLAVNRLKAALDKSRGRLGKLIVTKIEREAMVRELRAAIKDHRAEQVGGTTIDDEIEAPEDYQADRKDAKAFAKHVAQTLDLVGELKRLEPPKPKSSKRRRLDKADQDRDKRDLDEKDLDEEDRPRKRRDRTGRDSRDRGNMDRPGGARDHRDRDSRGRGELDEPPARRTRAARGRSSDDLTAFQKQLQALHKVVKRVSRGRTQPRRALYGPGDDRFSDDERDAGRDRLRDRRRDEMPRDRRRGPGDFDDRGRDRRSRDRRGPRDPRDDRPPDDRERDDRDRDRRR